MNRFAPVLFVVLLPVISACELISVDRVDDLESRMEELRKEIMDEIGEARAIDVTACAFIGFGAKPCGGPWTYLVYSTEETDVERLEQLVAEYNVLNDQLNRKKGLYSDCSVPPQPVIGLVEGRCKDTR